MKADRTTKSLLALITIFLGVIALRPSLLHGTVPQQPSDYVGVQVSIQPNDDAYYTFFDSRTGDIWTYEKEGKLTAHHKLNGLGRPMMSSSH